MISIFRKKRKDKDFSNYPIIQTELSESPTNSAMIMGSSHNDSQDNEIHIKRRIFFNIISIISSTFLGSIAYGMMAVLISFRLESDVKDEVLIAISSAISMASGIFFAKYLTSLAKKTGLVNGTIIAVTGLSISYLFFYFYFSYFYWLIITFLFGVFIFMIMVKKQVMIIEISPDKIRGLIVSILGMTGAIGNSLGPIVLKSIKTGESFLSFLIACILSLISVLPLLKIKDVKTNIKEEKKISIFRYIKTSPKIMFSGFVFSYCFTGICAFLIIYGIRIGLEKDEASILYSVLLLGTIFSIPFGYLVDLINRRLIMISGSVITLLLLILLYNIDNPDLLYLPLFLMFGSLIAMKLPAIVLINEKYKSTQRLAVNTAFMKVSVIGNLAGIFLTGLFMKYLGPEGLWVSMIFILSCYIIFCIFNYLFKYLRG